jgi:hypothetical protein
MDEALIPTWIKELKSKHLDEIRSRREQTIAESLIISESAKLWEHLIRELRIQVEACQILPGFGVCSVHDISQRNPSEKAYRALINGRGPYASCRFTDVHLRQEEPDIPYVECLCDALDHGRDFKLPFRVNPSGAVCLLLPTGDLADAESAAEYVVRSMVLDMGLS